MSPHAPSAPPSPAAAPPRGAAPGAALLALATLVALVRVTAPGVLYADIAEFQYLGAAGGTAHANGYPVYVTIANLWARLPLGEPAHRVNLLSAAAAALAAALLARWVAARTRDTLSGLAAGAAFALAPPVWILGTVALPYTCDAVALLGVLLALDRWEASRAHRWLAFAAFTWALEYGVHPGATLLAPAIVVLAAAGLRTAPGGRGRALAAAAAAFAGGLALVALAWWRQDARDTPHDFPHFYGWIEPRTWAGGLATPLQRFGAAMQDREWQHAVGDLPWPQVRTRVRELAQLVPGTLSPAGAVLAALGFVHALRTHARTALALGAFVAAQLGFWMTYHIPDPAKHYLPLWTAGFLLTGLGFAAASDALARRLPSPRRAAWTPWLRGALAVLLLAPPLVARRGALLNAAQVDREALSFHVHEAPERDALMSRAAVAALPARAVLFCHWDAHFLLAYRARFELHREDLLFPSASHLDRERAVRTWAAEAGRPVLFFDDPSAWLPAELRPRLARSGGLWALDPAPR